ncbi:hypothetical protein BJV74DRAFT_989955 [Russula compacta]|nr:hypothetical protein BJV74DRAFT_989955 [Russula compacta]
MKATRGLGWCCFVFAFVVPLRQAALEADDRKRGRNDRHEVGSTAQHQATASRFRCGRLSTLLQKHGALLRQQGQGFILNGTWSRSFHSMMSEHLTGGTYGYRRFEITLSGYRKMWVKNGHRHPLVYMLRNAFLETEAICFLLALVQICRHERKNRMSNCG